MLNQLRINRQVIYDLTAYYLEPLSGGFERIAYLASLRSDGHYAHEQLEAAYGQPAVRDALRKCHEELLERLLELPLSQQEADLRAFQASKQSAAPLFHRLLQHPDQFAPADAPDYLKQLFYSNLAVLRELLSQDAAKPHSST